MCTGTQINTTILWYFLKNIAAKRGGGWTVRSLYVFYDIANLDDDPLDHTTNYEKIPDWHLFHTVHRDGAVTVIKLRLRIRLGFILKFSSELYSFSAFQCRNCAINIYCLYFDCTKNA